MSVIFIVVPLATVVVLAAVAAFVVSARRGQFDDLETPAMRVLHDDPTRPQSVKRVETRSQPSGAEHDRP